MAVIQTHQSRLIEHDNPNLITCPALVEVTQRVNPTPTDSTALSHVTRGQKPTTLVISSSDGDRGSQTDNNGHSLHKPPTSANIAANTEACINNLQRSLCAPLACVNTARSTAPGEDAFSPTSKGYTSLCSIQNCAPPDCIYTARSPGPREDTISSTSKGYLSTSLSSAPNDQSAVVSHSFSNTLTHLRLPRHPPHNMTTTSGGPVPFKMHMCIIQWQRGGSAHAGIL